MQLWLGIGLVAVAWPLNWALPGLRTHLLFFPLWLGYCLIVDGWTLRRTGSSPLTRSWREWAAWFAVSAPAWWLFEAINLRTRNWNYVGREHFSDLQYALLATLCFCTVIPAVFGTAELVRASTWVERFANRTPKYATSAAPLLMLLAGIAMMAAVLLSPRQFFPFVWLSLFFILDPINLWLGNRSLLSDLRRGDWRSIVSLSAGALVCGFFWEMWNIASYPKWTYDVPPFEFWYVFEMPLLGYGGYIPFAWELFAMYQLVAGVLGLPRSGPRV